jgi:hypothetical protein
MCRWEEGKRGKWHAVMVKRGASNDVGGKKRGSNDVRGKGEEVTGKQKVGGEDQYGVDVQRNGRGKPVTCLICRKPENQHGTNKG